MVVPEQVKKCVAFVYYRPRRQAAGLPDLTPAGTAFLLGSRQSVGDGFWCDVVTARHVIDGIRSRSADGKAYLRVNTNAGPSCLFETALDSWEPHPDPATDVAILPAVVLPWDQLDVLFYDILGSLTDQAIAQNEIGVGDEVFMAGLFSNHHETDRCIPIIRVGNIAAMPGEPVRTGLGHAPAYLIECRSIGGLSGSPVFVHLGLMRFVGGDIRLAKDVGAVGAIFYLLGLVHGHYDVHAAPDAFSEDAPSLKDETINMGIAIVVPIQRVVEFINTPERLEMRKKTEEKWAKGEYPTMDIAPGPGVEKEEFEKTLRKVSRPVAQRHDS